MKIIKREKDQLKMVQETELESIDLERYFLEHPCEVIYVIKEEKLSGIITFGDYTRYVFHKGELIRKKFTFLLDENTDNQENNIKAEAIFTEKQAIHSIPVLRTNVSEGGVFGYELMRGDLDKEKLEREKLFEDSGYRLMENDLTELIHLIKLFGLERIIVIDDNDSIKSIVEQVSTHFLKENLDVVFMEGWEAVKFCKSFQCKNDKVLVIDMGVKCFSYRMELYHKYYIQTIGYWELMDILRLPMNSNCLENYTYSIHMLTETFDTIGVFGNNLIAEQILNARPEKCYCINNDDIFFDNDRQEFVLINHEETLEVIISCSFLIKENIVHANGREVLLCPFASLFQLMGNVRDYDIVYNLYKKLLSQGVKVLNIKVSSDKLKDKNIFKVLEDRSQIGNLLVKNRSQTMNMKEFREVLHYKKEEAELLVKEIAQLSMVQIKGFPDFSNFKGEFVNFYNGERYTKGNIKNRCKNNIYLFGPCTIYGIMVKDEDTIASYLQELVQEKYCVRNMGNHQKWKNFKIRNTEFKSGDIVIIMAALPLLFEKENIPMYDVTDAFNRIANLDRHVWENLGHCDHVVSESMANTIYDILRDNDFFIDNGEKWKSHINYLGKNQYFIILK